MKITQEGQPCRRCGTPVVKKIPKNTSKINYYFRCPKCGNNYMVMEADVNVIMPKKPGQIEMPPVLFVIFREVLNRNNIPVEIQKEIWGEYENELRTINKQ